MHKDFSFFLDKIYIVCGVTIFVRLAVFKKILRSLRNLRKIRPTRNSIYSHMFTWIMAPKYKVFFEIWTFGEAGSRSCRAIRAKLTQNARQNRFSTLLNIHWLSADERTCCTEKNTIQQQGGVRVNRLFGSCNIIISLHFVKRSETKLERSGG